MCLNQESGIIQPQVLSPNCLVGIPKLQTLSVSTALKQGIVLLNTIVPTVQAFSPTQDWIDLKAWPNQ
jgi:hypothetical protein